MQVCPWDSERDQDMRTRAPMHGQGQMNRSARIIEPKENAWDFQAFKKAYLERCSLTVMTPTDTLAHQARGKGVQGGTKIPAVSWQASPRTPLKRSDDESVLEEAFPEAEVQREKTTS
eukprot:s522_g8.t2